MRSVVIIQARSASARFPGKALQPVAGYPCVVLAALRAGNRGSEILVATSDDPSDDLLTEQVRNHGLRVFRGPMHDVLSRYDLAAANLSDDSTVVRLTGDNVAPDGGFVQELMEEFATAGLEYLVAASPQSRLPYGLGGEVFSVAALRRAHFSAISPYDREHVGPWRRRNCRSGTYIAQSTGNMDYSHLRCTIDDLEDYRRVLRLFEGVANPLQVSWIELLRKLASLSGEPSFRVPYKVIAGRIHSELTLGAAQLGLEYGIVNLTGKPPISQAIAMLHYAIAHGVTAVDTARAYGDSERILGKALSGAWRSRVQVVTKLDPLASLPADADSAAVRAAVEESISRSCQALHSTRLETLLLHRGPHRHLWKGAAWQQLLASRDGGMIATLGASVYEPAEALDALEDPGIQHLQIPLNVLDRRWKASGIERAIIERPDVIVHARSAFLQGVLLHPAGCWPWLSAYDANFCVQQLHTLVRRFCRESLADLCLSYVRSQPWITSVVVGCEIPSQLEENLRLFCLPRLTSEQCNELEHALPEAPECLLNPSKWNLAHEQCVPVQ
jgi:spore coat polysaccharide biosynthesis protein SpsF (cytidylyltransferase family)/aryl-alcohol dehydrogenase-like predicted oxidoreductase